MGKVTYTITSGLPNFVVQMYPSQVIPNNIHTSIGTYSFYDVPDGDYTLIVTDANGCVYTKSITVSPSIIVVNPPTAPIMDNIIVGNTDDVTLIFNENATNRDDHYYGYPNKNDVKVYLWFKTSNGTQLGVNKVINYRIEGISNAGNIINFISYNNGDTISITEDDNGEDSIISGQITFKPNFIEAYLNYNAINEFAVPIFIITLDSSVDVFNTSIPLVDDVKIYGVTNVDSKNIIMSF